MNDERRFHGYRRRPGPQGRPGGGRGGVVGPGFLARLRTYGPFRAPDGVIFGVAKGLAEHYGWSVGLVRLLFILATLFLFFWPTIIVYLVAAMVMSPAPAGGSLDTRQQRDIWLHTQMDPEGAMDQLADRAEKVEKRMRRLEDFVTSKDFSWQRRMGG